MNNDLISREALKKSMRKSINERYISWTKTITVLTQMYVRKGKKMTDKEKAIVMAYTGVSVLTGEKFSVFHKYIEDLLGRPVWTHEFADKSVWNEIKEKSKDDFIEICKTEDKPTGEWIPVSERLPEDMQPVLIWFEYYRYGEYNCMYQTYGFGYVCDGQWSPFINGETGWKDARIIAWMPLPEEYKEVDDEVD